MKSIHVYLVRHGKAEKDSPDGDAARCLTREGRQRFYALAGELARRMDVTHVVSSPHTRARQTAEILAAATGAPLEIEEGLAAGSSSGRGVLALARRMGSGTALVGHNPEMAEAVALAARREQKVSPGAVAAVKLGEHGADLEWIEAPDKE